MFRSSTLQIIFAVFLWCWVCAIPAYSFQNLDSLLISIQKQINDTSKVKNLIKVGKDIYDLSDFPKVLTVGEEALNLSLKLNYNIGQAESYYLIARANNKLNNQATALELYSRAQAIFQGLKRIDRLAALYNNVGLIYKNLGRYPNAVRFLSKSLEYYEELENTRGAASASNNLGSVYRRLGNYEKAAEVYFRSLKLFEELDSDFGVATINSNLANLYFDQKEFDKALKFNLTSIDLLQDIGEMDETADLLSDVAEIYVAKNMIDTAFTILNKSDSIYKSTGNRLGIAHTQDNIGRIYQLQQEYDLALKSHAKALEIFNDLGRKGDTPEVLSNMGYALMHQGKYDEALKKLKLSEEISQELMALDGLLSSYQGLYRLFEEQDDFNSSLKYFKLYTQIKDSLYNESKTKQIAHIEESYEIEKRERENDLLRQQQATQFEIIKRQNLQVKVLIGGLITFLLFAIYYYRINQQKKKTNVLLSQQNEEINRKQVEIMAVNQSLQLSEQQLHKANQELQTVNARLESTVKKRTSELQRTNHELDTFLYQSSHALRRPIVHVKGLVQLARLEPDPQEVIGLYDKLDDTATRMDLMLKKLVMASEIYVTEPEVETIHFEELINEVWGSLTDTLKVQTVKLEYSIPPNIHFNADRKLIKIMFLNLLENAIFYNEATRRKEARVSISLASNPKSIDIKVNDNGIGISEEAIASIFDLFSVGTDKTKGYGLGLYIVKKAVEKLQGVITVSSKRNEYTTFHITLPKEV